MVQILLFGISKDIIGYSTLTINLQELQISTVGALRTYLCTNYPSFTRLKSFGIAVNENYADDSFSLHANDTIAIIPPVSGG
jgi:molybdopterin synthase sulfur carrier subunit